MGCVLWILELRWCEISRTLHCTRLYNARLAWPHVRSMLIRIDSALLILLLTSGIQLSMVDRAVRTADFLGIALRYQRYSALYRSTGHRNCTMLPCHCGPGQSEAIYWYGVQNIPHLKSKFHSPGLFSARDTGLDTDIILVRRPRASGYATGQYEVECMNATTVCFACGLRARLRTIPLVANHGAA